MDKWREQRGEREMEMEGLNDESYRCIWFSGNSHVCCLSESCNRCILDCRLNLPGKTLIGPVELGHKLSEREQSFQHTLNCIAAISGRGRDRSCAGHMTVT